MPTAQAPPLQCTHTHTHTGSSLTASCRDGTQWHKFMLHLVKGAARKQPFLLFPGVFLFRLGVFFSTLNWICPPTHTLCRGTDLVGGAAPRRTIYCGILAAFGWLPSELLVLDRSQLAIMTTTGCHFVPVRATIWCVCSEKWNTLPTNA